MERQGNFLTGLTRFTGLKAGEILDGINKTYGIGR
jgi:hypothetical protein